MSRKISVAFLLAVAFTFATVAIAQDNGGNNPQSGQAGEQSEHGYGHRRFDPAQRTEMLTKQLKLNSDQQSKVQEVFKSEQSQMEKLRSDSSLSRDDRRSKMMDIRKSSDTEIRALLDSDQQKKWGKMQSDRGQWQGHRQEGAPPDASQPQ